MAIVYCAIATGDMIESHFSHSKQWMVGVQCPMSHPWEEALILALLGFLIAMAESNHQWCDPPTVA